jgi:quinol monooxygenase YgiN
LAYCSFFAAAVFERWSLAWVARTDCACGEVRRYTLTLRSMIGNWIGEKLARVEQPTITTKPGMRDAVLEAFRANMPNVHAEEGCIEYVLVVDFSEFGPFQKELGPDTFVIIEKWASPEALNAHAAAPHMKAYAEKTGGLIEKRVIHVLSPA